MKPPFRHRAANVAIELLLEITAETLAPIREALRLGGPSYCERLDDYVAKMSTAK